MSETPFEALTEKDRQMIVNYIETYAVDGKVVPMKKPLDHILRFWNKAKIDLFHLFGEKLMFTKTFSVNPSNEQVCVEITKYLRDNEFAMTLKENAYKMVIEKDGWYAVSAICNLVSPTALMDNRVAVGTDILMPDGKILNVPTGAKVMRVLQKIAKAYNLPGFEDFRNMISRFTEVRKEEVEITFSIHPLDYLTMSDNNYNWESCMNWTKGPGGYRAGTVEMLNSPNVIMAYISSRNFKPCPGVEWNSKSWRELVIVDPLVISIIKAYPYYNESYNDNVIDTLVGLAQSHWNIEYNMEEPEYDLCEEQRVSTWSTDEEDKFITFSTGYMYNDFGNARNKAVFNKTAPEDDPELFYSGKWSCMCCGDGFNPDDDEQSSAVVCEECDTPYYCSGCGDRIYGEVYEVDGEYFDEECYYNLTRDCFTKEPHVSENLWRVFIGRDDKANIRYGGHFMAPETMNQLSKRLNNPDVKCHMLITKYTRPFWGDTIIYIDEDTLTEDNKQFFIEDAESGCGYELSEWDMRKWPEYYYDDEDEEN